MTDQTNLPIVAQAHRPPTFSIAVEPRRDAVQIAPKGELDLATVEQLRHELAEVIDAGFTRIVIDLRGVEFLDSTGLHALITADAHAQRDGWTLEIIPGPRAVQRIFELTCTLDRLPFTTNGGAGGPAPARSTSAPPPDITATNGARAQA